MPKRKIVIPIIIITALVLALYLPIQYIIANAADSSNTEKEEIIPLPPYMEEPGVGYSNGSQSGGGMGNNLEPNEHTPDSYRKPIYDPFESDVEPGQIPDYLPIPDVNDTAPKAAFNIRTDQRGLASKNSGTLATTFIFDASISRDGETSISKLKARWDFESDGKWDTHFSRTKSVKHQFEKPGMYKVTVQILDGGGNTDTAYANITVVRNTAPHAFYTYRPESGTPGTIFLFDTSASADSQYTDSRLQYRFDWDGDGKWDTIYQYKTSWKHQFDAPGTYNVKLEVMDPEEETATYVNQVNVYPNSLPYADFTIEVREQTYGNGQILRTYYFDASASYDPETPQNRLQYRWDFNYTGEDDISFNQNWGNYRTYTGTYETLGPKIVRLQVRDQDGAITETFKSVYVNG